MSFTQNLRLKRPTPFEKCRLLPISAYNVRALKENLSFFVNKIQVQSNKVCYKVSLRENFQQRNCNKTIPLTNGV